ncbi:hypothetical protein ILP97_05125 [Amycolatopsis sp. H6(2020)]|nr:hypothetical protein [Amycolatopsis sp. H6(2020)]
MTRHVIDPMDDATRWSAFTADGATPSTRLSMADESVVVGTGLDGTSAKVTAVDGADGHLLRRTMAPVDVTACAELRLSIRADRHADGRDRPFFAELRLASAAMPLSHPANTWHRLLPVRARHTWETVRLSIDDLPAAVAGALTTAQLRCVSAPFTAYLDDVLALRPQMVADADRALIAALADITVGSTPTAVPVAVRAQAEPAPEAVALDIVHVDLRPAPLRAASVGIARDHTSAGCRFADPGPAYDLDYVVRPVAAARAAQAALIEAVIDRIPAYGELVVDGDRLPIELVPPTGHTTPDAPVLVYRVGVRQPARVGPPMTDVVDVRMGTDQLGVRP